MTDRTDALIGRSLVGRQSMGRCGRCIDGNSIYESAIRLSKLPGAKLAANCHYAYEDICQSA